MSPHRTGPGGDFRFDRIFQGVGRVRRSSGTTNAKEFQRRDALLTKLFESAQLDVLRAFQRGDISIEQLVEAERAGRLKSAELLADMALRRNLWEAADETLPEMGQSPETRRRYEVSLEKLRRTPEARLGKDARVSDLAGVNWRALNQTWDGSPADWNHLRRALGRFLTLLLGDVYHPFRRSIMKAVPTEDEGEGRVPDLTLEVFWDIVGRTPEHARPCYVVLATTGMRTGEYLRCTKANLKPATLAIDVPGTKTHASRATVYVHPRLWPWIEAGIPSPLRYRWMRIYFKRAAAAAGKPELRLHDLRHFTAQLATNAGLPTVKIQAAMRHADPSMTMRYQRQRDKAEVARAVGGLLVRGRDGGRER